MAGVLRLHAEPVRSNLTRRRIAVMARKLNAKQNRTPKRVLLLPDLDHAKRTVLNSLGSPDSTRAYEYVIDDFIACYCSEPRLAFGKHVVLRYRIELESRLLAPATINVRLAAVRRLAYEAADSGLLSPELAAGIQRVKGAKKLGVRLGNWLTVDECRRLLRAPDEKTLKGKRDRASFVIQAGPEFKRLGKNSLDEMCMATPAIYRSSLIVRTASKLYRIQNGGPL